MTGGLEAGVFEVLGAQLAAFLALLLAASAVHKWTRFADSQRAAREFAGLPRSLAAAAILAAGILELLAASLLLGTAHRAGGAVLALVLWSAYFVLLVGALARGRRDVDCGCSFGAARHRLGALDLARNALLVLLAGALALAGRGAQPVAVSQWLGAAALLALYVALDQVLSLQPLKGRTA